MNDQMKKTIPEIKTITNLIERRNTTNFESERHVILASVVVIQSQIDAPISHEASRNCSENIIPSTPFQ